MPESDSTGFARHNKQPHSKADTTGFTKASATGLPGNRTVSIAHADSHHPHADTTGIQANRKQFFPSATFLSPTQLDLLGAMSDPTPKPMQLALPRLIQLVSLAIGMQAMPMPIATACMPMQLVLPADGKWVKAIPKAPSPKQTQLVSLAERKWVTAIPKA